MKNRKSAPLVTAHANDIDARVLRNHLAAFRKFVGPGRPGIYVLWKDDICFYVGLASSLRSRLGEHMRDHLKGKWDRFSLYLVKKSKAKYLKDVETLLIRTARPQGNNRDEKFAAHKNITKDFKRQLIAEVSDFFVT